MKRPTTRAAGLVLTGAVLILSAGCSTQGLANELPGPTPSVSSAPPDTGPCKICEEANAASAAVWKQDTTTAAPPPTTNSTPAPATSPATSSASTTAPPSMARLQAAGIPTKCARREVSQATCQRDGLTYG